MNISRLSRVCVSLIDPSRIIALHRRLQAGVEAKTGKGVRTTDGTRILNHSGQPDRIDLGDHVMVDGTLEVYERGRITIGAHSFIGRSRIYASLHLTIGRWVYVSDNCAIMDSDLHPAKAALRQATSESWATGRFPDVYSGVSSGPVSIGDRAWLGFACIVLKGVRIGEGAIVAAGSVVTQSVPDWAVAAGNPARVIRETAKNDR